MFYYIRVSIYSLIPVYPRKGPGLRLSKGILKNNTAQHRYRRGIYFQLAQEAQPYPQKWRLSVYYHVNTWACVD